MTAVSMSGANGFLGWHTRCAARCFDMEVTPIAVGHAYHVEAAASAVEGTGRFLHLAGINRGSDDEVRDGNLLFARQASEALLRVDMPPSVVVYANSSQAGNGSVYGEAKSRAADMLAEAAESIGARFIDLRLPNLFGEHGRPFYNSVVATFCHGLATGGEPRVDQDRELRLLHAQDAAELLLGTREHSGEDPREVRETVTGLLDQLSSFASIYRIGDIPDISERFDRDLFNTYRSFAFVERSVIDLERRADRRGSFFELLRSHGGSGQSSFSTTTPGMSRGDHYHRRKVERFTVLSGAGVITLRKLFSTARHEFPVSGEAPVAIDMPTMWAHNIVNVGQSELFTSFWSNEIFDPSQPDTYAEAV